MVRNINSGYFCGTLDIWLLLYKSRSTWKYMMQFAFKPKHDRWKHDVRRPVRWSPSANPLPQKESPSLYGNVGNFPSVAAARQWAETSGLWARKARDGWRQRSVNNLIPGSSVPYSPSCPCLDVFFPNIRETCLDRCRYVTVQIPDSFPPFFGHTIIMDMSADRPGGCGFLQDVLIFKGLAAEHTYV